MVCLSVPWSYCLDDVPYCEYEVVSCQMMEGWRGRCFTEGLPRSDVGQRAKKEATDFCDTLYS
jgi:hypothetical protein